MIALHDGLSARRSARGEDVIAPVGGTASTGRSGRSALAAWLLVALAASAACGAPDSRTADVDTARSTSAAAGAADGPAGAGGANADAASGPDRDAAADPVGDPGDVPDSARVVLVTGSTDGLGREVARRLAARGDHVIVHGRDRERGRALVREIEASSVGSARFYRADFASFENVRELAGAIRRDYERLDVLVNNAGLLVSPDERPLSRDGHELHFQVNYLSAYLLTRLLLPVLRESAPARIVNVASRSQHPLEFGNLMLEEGYSAGRAYGQSKLALVMFTFELAEELEGTGVTVNALHPASLMDTDLVTDMGMEPRSTVEEGARAVLHLIDADDVGSGEYYDRMSPARAEPQAYDAEARARLMERSRELTGLAGSGR